MRMKLHTAGRGQRNSTEINQITKCTFRLVQSIIFSKCIKKEICQTVSNFKFPSIGAQWVELSLLKRYTQFLNLGASERDSIWKGISADVISKGSWDETILDIQGPLSPIVNDWYPYKRETCEWQRNWYEDRGGRLWWDGDYKDC